MREVLFRAKAINRDVGSHRTSYKNGDWVYGLITRLYDERFETLPAEMRDIDGVNGVEIDYKTIGQYTGLTDKNGKKIFEGDTVLITDDNGNTNFPDGGIGDVEFYDGLWYVSGKVHNGLNDLAKVYYIEVIGNIYF